MEKLTILDESGDRKYFTIIPNYVLNHSTLYDRELYVQMKRLAGEKGTCWASRASLAKQCGMSTRRVDKSLKYLLEHDWIYKKGNKKIETRGGAQTVVEYAIADLWKQNVEFYDSIKGGAGDAHPLVKGGARNDPKGGAPGAHKEEPLSKEEPKNTPAPINGTGDDIGNFIRLFGGVNPSYDQLFKRTSQRNAAERLLKKQPLSWWTKFMEGYIGALEDQFCPRATTPMQLEDKLGAIMAHARAKKNKGGVIIKI